MKSGHHCCPCQAPPPPVLVTTSPSARIIRQSSQPEASACCCSGCCCPLHTATAPSAASLRQLREPGDGIAGIAADSLRINGGIRQFRQVSRTALRSVRIRTCTDRTKKKKEKGFRSSVAHHHFARAFCVSARPMVSQLHYRSIHLDCTPSSPRVHPSVFIMLSHGARRESGCLIPLSRSVVLKRVLWGWCVGPRKGYYESYGWAGRKG